MKVVYGGGIVQTIGRIWSTEEDRKEECYWGSVSFG